MIRIELPDEDARVCDALVFRLDGGAVGSWRDVDPCALVDALLIRAENLDRALVPNRSQAARLRRIANQVGDALDALPARRLTDLERALAHARLPVGLRDPRFVLA